MKRIFIAMLMVALVAGTVYAGSSGVTNTITDRTTHAIDGGLKDKAKATLDSVITVLDTLTTQNTVLVQGASITAVGTVMTNTFATAFSVAPVVTLTYTEDPGDVQPAYLGTVTTSNFIATVTSSKNYNYIAVGTR